MKANPRHKAWKTRRKKYGPNGHRGSYARFRPAGGLLDRAAHLVKEMDDAISDVGAITNLGTIPLVWKDLKAMIGKGKEK